MKSVVTTLCLLGAATLLCLSGPAAKDRAVQPADNQVRRADIVRVVDGDTLVANIYLGCGVGLVERHIRMEGVHAYESGTEKGDLETGVLRAFIERHADLHAAVEMKGADKYGRLLGVVWLGDNNLNALMAAQPQGGR